jgi:riboflavin synthase
MFTGIVEELGTVRRTGPRLVVACAKVAEDSAEGASVAVNGVCLTVVVRARDGDGAPGDGGWSTLAFDVSPETVRRSSLGRLRPGDGVNLERPATLLSRLGGHLVQGHVDGVGRILGFEDSPPGRIVRIELPLDLTRYVVEKGSIAVDGVSLTVADLAIDVDGSSFSVALIPFTLEVTTFGSVGPGAPVNLEVDVMAKYVEALLQRGLLPATREGTA